MTNNLVFNWIKVKNFFSIGEIDFNFLTHSGMNYVFGQNKDLNLTNGSGKSSLFTDAILFALFGRTSKNVNKNNIIHRLVKKEAEVHLNFTINSNTFLIISSITPTHCKLFKDGVEITKSSIKETYDFISREVIKTTFDIFKNSIILSVNDTPNIFVMSKGEKRNFIEQLFNLTLIGKMYSKIRVDLNALDKDLMFEKNLYTKFQEDIENFKTKQSTFKTDKERKLSQLSSNAKLIKENLELIEDPSTHEISIKSLNAELIELDKKYKGLVDIKQKIESEINLTTRDIKNNNQTFKKYSDIIEIICEDCNVKLDEIVGISDIEKKLIQSEQTIKGFNEKIEKLNSLISTIDIKRTSLKKQISTIQQVIDKIKTDNLQKPYLQKKLNDILVEISNEKKSKSPFDELMTQYEEKKEASNSKITELVDHRGYLDFLVFTLSEDGVKKCLISDLINALNNRIRKYLEEMGCEYTAIFDPNFDCTFLTVSGPCEYSNFSAGERRRIDIASVFAFRDLLFGQGTLQSNILVCDEILDISIDEFCINSIIKILKNEALKQTIFIISHRECVNGENDFDNVIELKKESGFTSIVSDLQGGIL